VTYDVANALAVESPTASLPRVAPHLVLLHLSDTRVGHWGHDRIGSGSVDFAGLIETVRRLGYRGRTILEIVDPASPDEANRVSLERLRALGWDQ
jgi:sugar phosphate isomerase/epimerase